jgi:hypothetical protein
VSTRKYELAVDLVASAEALVQRAEQAVASAGTYLERDLAETELMACQEVENQALEAVAPAIARRRVDLRDEMFAALRAASGDPSADWALRHRKFHTRR